MPENKLDLKELLQYVDPASLDYLEWTQIGMALKTEGYSAEDWEDWSSTDPRHVNGECLTKWDSFNGAGITGAFITAKAKENGWEPASRGKVRMSGSDRYNVTYSWEDDQLITDQARLETEEFQEPKNWNPVSDAISYLQTLFDPGDYVGYVMRSRYIEDRDKYIPADKGTYTVTAGQLIDALNAEKSIEKAFGTYDVNSGAWIRFNPLNGSGVKNDNVSEFKYALVECDNMSLEKQIALMKELQLPIAAMVYSGKKSIHAIVHIDASSYAEYRSRVDYLYQICSDNGLMLDTQNKNPSRLSRMPGVYRNGHKQFLIDTNIGKESYEAWKDWVDETTDNLPDPISLTSQFQEDPPLAGEMIQGILRQGHKMLISGPSKAGKSFLLMELCIAIAEGMNWIGRRCTQGKVLYINLEIDAASCYHRFKAIYEALGLNVDTHQENIDIWNLRGHAMQLNELTPKLIRRCKAQNYIAIIIDPIYKIITGSENDAADMGKFCNEFDRIAEELHASVIYCHHHSKGFQGQKKAQDRMSGSGVFARDPDAVVDMVQLDLSDAINEVHTGWRVESTLREFPNMKPIDLWFEYPIHKVTDDLKDAMPESDLREQQKEWAVIDEDRKKKREEKKKQKEEEELVRFWTVFCQIEREKGSVTVPDLKDELGIEDNRTIKKRLDQIPELEIVSQENGKPNVIRRKNRP